MRKTKIVCTVGPASEDKETLKLLMEMGMDVARLNFSHGTHQEHLKKINTIKETCKEAGKDIAIMLDTKGPEIRTGNFDKEEVPLIEGQKYIFVKDEILGNQNYCSLTYKNLEKDLKIGDEILVDDGSIRMIVEKIVDGNIECCVMNNGIIKAKKSLNFPNVKINLPSLTEKDIEDIEFGIEQGIDYIAASFVRKAADVKAIKQVLEQKGSDIKIISKIENREGIENIDEIIAVSDGIMVARGDMGVEIPQEQVPIVQKQIIKKCNKKGIPVITATQMLDSMIRNPRPTRAEVTDVANAIYDGTDAIMLSGETAAGKYPIEALKMMDAIAQTAEADLDFNEILDSKLQKCSCMTITDAIGNATCNAARDIDAKLIITPTQSGDTAFIVSKFRPKVPIFATCYEHKVARRLSLCFGAKAVIIEKADTQEAIYEKAMEAAKVYYDIQNGDRIIITAGIPLLEKGNTNAMRIHIVGEKLI